MTLDTEERKKGVRKKEKIPQRAYFKKSFHLHCSVTVASVFWSYLPLSGHMKLSKSLIFIL